MTTSSKNVAARMGRWSADHWKTATFGWLAFVVVAFGLGGMVGTKNIASSAGPGESGRMDRILEAGFEQPANEHVLIQSGSHRVGTTAFDAAITDVVARVSKIADVRDVRSPLAPGYAAQISKDRHSALVQFQIRGDKEKAVHKIDPVLDTVAAAKRAHPGFTIGEFGDASAEQGVVASYDEDLGKAGALSLPITLIVLVLTFGSLVAAIVAGGLLVALALPALQLRLTAQGTESFPKSIEVIQTYDRMQQAFPGSALPANVVVEAASVRTPAMQKAIGQLERRALASGRAFEPITVDLNDAGTVANITVPIAGNGTDAASNASFRMLRDEVVPETVGALPGTQAGVTGQTAEWRDQADALKSNLLPVVAFVLLFAFGLMLVAFRSIVVAAKAILLNLLSVAAAYGVLVLVFQHGVGKGLLGVSSATGIDAVVPLLLFVILFGLSMDYHVFILSRIRETFDRGKSMDEAVAHGIKSTAGVVTSAAIVMVAVFAVFATLSWPFFKQFGVGLSAAILIDATIVRAVLLPAMMKLLGNWNWYLPSWLEWLPRFDASEPEAPPEAKPTAVSA